MKGLALFGIAVLFCCLTASRASSIRFIDPDGMVEDGKENSEGGDDLAEKSPEEESSQRESTDRRKREIDLTVKLKDLADLTLENEHNWKNILESVVTPAFRVGNNLKIGYINILKNLANVDIPPEVMNKVQAALKIGQKHSLKMLSSYLQEHYPIKQ